MRTLDTKWLYCQPPRVMYHDVRDPEPMDSFLLPIRSFDFVAAAKRSPIDLVARWACYPVPSLMSDEAMSKVQRSGSWIDKIR